jgi:large subunit ribosomal protein L24
MAERLKIKKGDIVKVVAGASKGSSGDRKRVLKVFPDRGKIIVEGVNVIHKHLRRSQKNPQGVRVTKEAPINISNVKLVCPNCDTPTRVGRAVQQDGKLLRVCKKCNEAIKGNR